MHNLALSAARDKIVALEAAMNSMPQIRIEPRHHFAPGIYMREITIPAGCTLTGKIHKTEHLCILSKGEVWVHTESGIRHLTAGAVVHSLPGIKRVLYAKEESIWVNVHYNPDNLTDIDQVEEFFVVDTFEQYQVYADTKLQLTKQGEI